MSNLGNKRGQNSPCLNCLAANILRMHFLNVFCAGNNEFCQCHKQSIDLFILYWHASKFCMF